MAQDELLITFTDLQNIKGNLSLNVEADQIDPYIIEAQTGEIRKFLGDELYLELLTGFDKDDPTTPGSDQIFIDLMLGKEYTNLEGKLVKFNGLEECIKYWAYYRYLRDADLLVSRFGNRVAEDSTFSSASAREQVKRSVYNAKSRAQMFQTDTESFIRANIADYTAFDNNRRHKKTRSFELNKLPQGDLHHEHFFGTNNHHNHHH